MKKDPKLADAKTRIKWAKAILLKFDREAVKELVESCVHSMLYHEWQAKRRKAERERPRNDDERKAVERVAGELRRLNAALRNPELPAGILKSLPTDLLEARRIELEEMARRPKKPNALDPNLKKKKKRPARSNLRWDAARYASMTLQKLDIERVTTRRRTLHQLAAAYYGNKDADLFDYIRFYYDVDHLDAGEG